MTRLQYIWLTLALMLAAIAIGVAAQERVDLTTPVVVTTASYRPVRLVLDTEQQAIEIRLRGPNGELKACAYNGPTAMTLMVALNKANLTTRSLNQRILDQVIADGCVTGTVAGSVP